MDAIRKKMQSLKSETDGLYKTIAGFEEATREAAARADQVDLTQYIYPWRAMFFIKIVLPSRN